MKTLVKKIKPSPPALAGVILIMVLLGWFLLFAPEVVGITDNGDFSRVTGVEGLYYKPQGEGDTEYFSYFHRIYGKLQYFHEFDTVVFTSQTLFIKAAIFLDDLFTGEDGEFDIRFYAALHILYLAIAVYYLVDYVTANIQHKSIKYLVAGMVVIIFGDLAYTAYFNAFYAEGLVMVSFIFSMVCALHLANGTHSPWSMLILSFINGIILTTAKQQNAPQGILSGLLIMLLPFAAWWGKNRKKKSPAKNVGQSRTEDLSSGIALAVVPTKAYQNLLTLRTRRFRVIAFLLGGLLCVCGVLVYVLIPQSFVYTNAYHGMTQGVLLTSENPEETLSLFGIDRQYALLTDTVYFEKYPPIFVNSQILIDNFYSKYSFSSLTAYYLNHPGKLMQMLDLAARSGYQPNPEYAGNYEFSAGKGPGARSESFHYWSKLKQVIVPKTLGFIVIWAILALFLSRRGFGQRWVVLICILSGVSQLAISVITAGTADLSKHVFAYNIAFDFVNCIGLAVLVSWLGSPVAMWIERKLSDLKATGSPHI